MQAVPWSHYEAQLALRGEVASPRLAYLDGVLELMSPSREHERRKSYIGCLVEAYALERGLDLSPYGSWTLKSAPRQSGAEPDECYIVGTDQDRDRPDLVIEVVWTSGGIDKLEIYRRLGVGEVWFWRDGRIEVRCLHAGTYESATRSRLFPDLDIELLCSFLDRPTALQAVRACREALRK
jgi:Uma2 family endonuclease